ncbi:MAG: flagellar filament capping protein FliD [Defluviitaleaceae bacterium]|nr:flagellar filament capping protein FliD [Defluviitaleaceae bacterium]MCL2240704.1 flagellar filament capping protein FliD [Defluviitaleaceae bacterium]
MRITSSMMRNTHHFTFLPGGLDNRNRFPNIGGQMNNTLLNAATFVNNARPRATSLISTLSSLPNILSQRNAVSHDTDIVQVRSFNGRELPETAVNIEQLAVAQQNDGKAHPAGEKDIAPGTFRLEIEIDGDTHEVSFTVTEPITNLAFMQRMAEQINQANTGVTASVANGPDNTRFLRLTAAATGAGEAGEPRFTLRDTEGDAVAFTGADTVTREGQDAVFSVNGGESQTSPSNEISLPGGLQITLVSTGEATLTVGRNIPGTQQAVRQMVNDINALLETARANTNDARTRSLLRSLETQLHISRSSLQAMGITTSNGRLTINDNQLRQAAENGMVERFLGTNNNRPSAFVGNLSRLANNVAQNPMRHISSGAARLPGFSATLNALANGQEIPDPQPSPFNADFWSDPMGNLWNGLR